MDMGVVSPEGLSSRHPYCQSAFCWKAFDDVGWHCEKVYFNPNHDRFLKLKKYFWCLNLTSKFCCLNLTLICCINLIKLRLRTEHNK